MILALLLAAAQPAKAKAEALAAINRATYAIENREDGGPVDDALVDKLFDAAEALSEESPLPNPRTNYPAYAKYTDYQFECDDRPYTKGCGNDVERLKFCGTRWTRHILADPEHRPLSRDPWVRRYVRQGMSLKDAKITRADDVVNGCDE